MICWNALFSLPLSISRFHLSFSRFSFQSCLFSAPLIPFPFCRLILTLRIPSFTVVYRDTKIIFWRSCLWGRHYRNRPASLMIPPTPSPPHDTPPSSPLFYCNQCGGHQGNGDVSERVPGVGTVPAVVRADACADEKYTLQYYQIM